MAHEIDMTTGKAAAAYAGDRGTPWHKLGTMVATAANSVEMKEAAGLTWTVEKGPLYGGFEVVDGYERPRAFADRFTLYRSDSGAPLGTCAAIYQPWQIDEQFAFLDSLIADGSAAYETALSLKGGRITVATLRLPEDVRIGDDAYASYMLVSAGHDGNTGINITPTNVRVVCMNTLSSALMLAEKERRALHITHLPNISSRLDEARRVLAITTEAQRNLAKILEEMLTKRTTVGIVAAVVEEMFGPEPVRTTATKNQVEAFRTILAEEQGMQGKTAYSLVQAVTGFADHGLRQVGQVEAMREERRFFSVTDGTAAAFKTKGLAAIRELVKI